MLPPDRLANHALKAAGIAFQVSSGAILGECRKRPLPDARITCSFLLHRIGGLSLSQAARGMGCRPSTILQNTKRAEEFDACDPKFRARFRPAIRDFRERLARETDEIKAAAILRD